jgi:hypothetical protein
VRLAKDSAFALLSQVQHKDLLMYLLAVKSFCRRLLPRAIHVLSDGSLTGEDFATLERHIPGVAFLRLEDFRSDKCPTGGTWERLLAISDKVAESYVIQLDADTLSVGPLSEVAECIGTARAFTIGTWDDQRPEFAAERRDVAAKLAREGRVHVQVLAEAHLDCLHTFQTMRYIRGCSGFSGFPRRSFSRADVERISVPMTSALGERWREWGTEQFTSNLIVANSASPAVLPHPKYCDCTQYRGRAVFVHFIGTCRFSGDRYRTLGRREISFLEKGSLQEIKCHE